MYLLSCPKANTATDTEPPQEAADDEASCSETNEHEGTHPVHVNYPLLIRSLAEPVVIRCLQATKAAHEPIVETLTEHDEHDRAVDERTLAKKIARIWRKHTRYMAAHNTACFNRMLRLQEAYDAKHA